MAQHQGLWTVNLEATKFWSFPRSPAMPTIFLMSTVSPLGRWKPTVSSPLGCLDDTCADKDMAVEEVAAVSSWTQGPQAPLQPQADPESHSKLNTRHTGSETECCEVQPSFQKVSPQH